MATFSAQTDANMSEEENLGNSSDDNGVDIMASVLDMLNFKIVDKGPGDYNYRDDSEPFGNSTFSTARNDRENAHEKSFYEKEIEKWRNYCQMAESRMHEAEARSLKNLRAYQRVCNKYAYHHDCHEHYKTKFEQAQNTVQILEQKLAESTKDNIQLQLSLQNLQETLKEENSQRQKTEQKLKASDAIVVTLVEDKKVLRANVKKLQTENKGVLMKSQEQQENLKKLKTELDSKTYYVKEMERIMEQQQMILRNTKDKYKKESEEQKDLIMTLELDVAGKQSEIDKLTETLAKLRHKYGNYF